MFDRPTSPSASTLASIYGCLFLISVLFFSMMPSGLNQALSQQDLIDLGEYLSSLKKN